MAEMSKRYEYVKGLADSAQERAKGFHKEFQEYHKKADHAVAMCDWVEEGKLREAAAAKLNDFFYWIGHSNAYRGIALQVDFMETVEVDEDAEARCP